MIPLKQPAELNAYTLAETVYGAVIHCATTLRDDVQKSIAEALVGENEPRACAVLSDILENACIAKRDKVALCQDTGTVWVYLEVGENIGIPGDIFSLVDEAVGRAYTDARLRMSVVKDALFDRSNTENNTPAFTEISFLPGSGATLHVLLKGGGSDNASRVVMLAPGAKAEGVRQVVLDCVREKAANACPPLIVGVGVGATFDKVGGLAKRALLRPIGSAAASNDTHVFEQTLLADINACGIGPAALGGKTTALAVHVQTAPCHIATLPVAVNMGCCAMRSVSIELIPWK